MKLYHVTPGHNLDGIFKKGLIPQKGAYASEMGESEKAIWLFQTLEDADEMIPIWLEPFFGDDLVILEITLPDDYQLEYSGRDYEVYTTMKIGPEHIRISEERN